MIASAAESRLVRPDREREAAGSVVRRCDGGDVRCATGISSRIGIARVGSGDLRNRERERNRRGEQQYFPHSLKPLMVEVNAQRDRRRRDELPKATYSGRRTFASPKRGTGVADLG